MSNQQNTFAEQALQEHAPSCGQGHDWQPTIIIGYFQCTRCSKLAACKVCVSKVRSRALVGYCQTHQQLILFPSENDMLLCCITRWQANVLIMNISSRS